MEDVNCISKAVNVLQIPKYAMKIDPNRFI